MKKSDRIFVAGHKGLVGSSILDLLKKKGFKNLITIDRKNLDLRNYHKVEKFFKFKKIDYMIMAAARAGGIIANSQNQKDFFLDNIEIQNSLLKLALKKNIKRTIFLGTSCIYPKFSKTPIDEDSLLKGPLEKTNQCYAIAKISGIKLCSSIREQYGFDAISLMPTNLYGPGDNYHLTNSHVLPSLIRKFYSAKVNNKSNVTCWGSGSPKREFLHVDDLAEAVVHILEKVSSNNNLLFEEESRFNGIINIGTGKDISIKELAELISKETEYRGKIIWDKSKPDGTPRKLLDVSIANQLGWQARIDIKNGIKLTIKSFIEELQNGSVRL